MKIKKDILHVKKQQPQPRSGDILISEPFLTESYFERSVIAVIENNERENAMGIVLNKLTKFTLNEAINNLNSDAIIPLYCGGPLSTDHLFYIHTLGSVIADSAELSPGLYFGGDFRQIKAYLESGNPIEGKIRFFLGYSGWEPGQLSEELNNYVWVVSSMLRDVDEYISGDDAKSWRDAVKDLGGAYRKWLVCPEHPYLN